MVLDHAASASRQVGSELDARGVNRLAPYLPRIVVDWVREETRDLHREVTGTVCFVNARVSVGSVPAATDGAVATMSPTATVAALNAAAARTDRFTWGPPP